MRLGELRGGRLLVVLGLAALTLLVVGQIAAGAYVEILWFDAVRHSSVFWTRVIWEWGARITGAAVVAVAIIANLRLAARTLGGIRIRSRIGDLVISEQVPQAYVTWGTILTGLLLGMWFGSSIPRTIGLETLFLLRAPRLGCGRSHPGPGSDVLRDLPAGGGRARHVRHGRPRFSSSLS